MRISDWSSDVCSSDLLADPAVRLLTSTVTEKGYCLAPDGTLDLSHPDIVHDLADRAAPVSIVGWIVAGLAARRAAGTAPFAVDRKSTRLNSSHSCAYRMPSSA